MNYRTLGRTGLKVSEIGFGAWAVGGTQSPGQPSDAGADRVAVEAIRRAVELGCNFFDTADVYGYGHSEEILAEGLSQIGQLNEAIIATKGGSNFSSGQTVMDYTASHLTEAVEASLRRLKRDYIDLYQLHNPSRQVIGDGTVFEVLDKLKAAGKIRFYGVSVHSVVDGLACLKNGKSDALQIVYNVSSLLQNDDPAEQLFPLALEQGVGLIAREPLANGFLTGTQRVDTVYEPGDIRGSWPSHYRAHKIRLAESLRFLERPDRTLAQAAIRFTLDTPAVSTVVVGIKTPRQADENLSVAALPSLSPDEQQQLRKTLFG